MKILVEGWRFISHSYSCINMWQCIELSSRDNVALYHRDKAYYQKTWGKDYNLLDYVSYSVLKELPKPKNKDIIDVVYRIHYPHNLSRLKNSRLFVFLTTEFSWVYDNQLIGNKTFRNAYSDTTAVIITPSTWSKNGLIRSGADPQRIEIIPHGVELRYFKPLTIENRNILRKKLGWEGKFVFLNISAMTNNKGIDFLLKAFSAINSKNPDTILCLKGTDSLFSSVNWFHNEIAALTPEEYRIISPNLFYCGKELSFAEVASLYQAADAYVSPYSAEGFNLPVLEAAACGLPSICTSGGPTDDFTLPSFSLHIDSKLVTKGNAILLQPSLENLIYQMQNLIESPEFSQSARSAGPEHVKKRYTWEKVVDRMLEVFS